MTSILLLLYIFSPFFTFHFPPSTSLRVPRELSAKVTMVGFPACPAHSIDALVAMGDGLVILVATGWKSLGFPNRIRSWTFTSSIHCSNLVMIPGAKFMNGRSYLEQLEDHTQNGDQHHQYQYVMMINDVKKQLNMISQTFHLPISSHLPIFAHVKLVVRLKDSKAKAFPSKICANAPLSKAWPSNKTANIRHWVSWNHGNFKVTPTNANTNPPKNKALKDYWQIIVP